MPVKHLAVDPITADPDASLKSVAETMDEEGIGDVIITNGQKPAGIVTDRDVAMAFAEHDDAQDLHAADVMSEDPVTVEGDAEAVELPRKMAEGRVRRIPVVDADGALTGVATLDDVVAVAGEELKNIATVIESQSPDYSPG
ncbi:MAG: CBS domain-containing protein [Halobacteriaceae archaeon]